MAELGSTHDPKALIPGSPEQVHAQAQSLSTHSSTTDQVGNDVKAVSISGWTGDAADAFEGFIAKHPPLWFQHSDDLTTAAGQLTTYADTLSAAQGKAAEAIRLWDQGEQQSKTFAHQQSQPDADPSAQDPGTGSRSEAQAILAQARLDVDNAGNTASSTLSGLVSGISFPLASGAASGSTDTMGADASASGVEVLPDGTIQLGTAQAEAYLLKMQGSASGDFLGIHGEASGSVFVGADANASATIGADGINAKAGAFAGVRAEGDASASYGYGEVSAHGKAEAGAGADAHADLGPGGVSAGGEAFAGARASGSVHGDMGGVGATGDAEGWAGVGATADMDVGYHDGKITIGGHIGAALGLGGKLGGEITIDPGKVVDTVGDLAGDVGDVATDFAGDVGDAAGDFADGVGDVASSLTGGLL